MLIKYIKSVLWRVAKCLSYIEEARCLKVNFTPKTCPFTMDLIRPGLLGTVLILGVLRSPVAVFLIIVFGMTNFARFSKS